MELRDWKTVLGTVLFVVLQTPHVAGIKHLNLSLLDRSSSLPSGQVLVPLELSSAKLMDLLTTSEDFAPVRLDTFVTSDEWALNNWSGPVANVLAQSHTSDQSVLIDVQLNNIMDIAVSHLIVQADAQLHNMDVSLVFRNDALAGVTGLCEIHVVGMTTTFEGEWLREGVYLNHLTFDESTLENLELNTSVVIQEVVIRYSSLSFPTAVLGLDNEVTTLILEHNTIVGPILLTENEYAQLSNISDFRATANTVVTSADGLISCDREEMIRDLLICVVNGRQRAAFFNATSDHDANSNIPEIRGSRESQGANTSSTQITLSITVIVLVSACAVGLIVVLSLLRRFKKKASKFVDERLTSSNREDGLLAGREGETESKFAVTDDRNILTDMDLGKAQVTLHKKLGIQSLWLGEYKDTEIVALKFVPRELNMSIKELNAIRMSYISLRHDNIVHFMGFSWTDREEVLLVVEHMSMGSLRLVLAEKKIDLAWSKRRQMSKDICSGLNFVRSIQKINLSRNLTAKSVLLDAQFVCKMDIFDYALSLRRDFVPARSFGNGEIASRAPELLQGDKITAAAEVYALGIILCEISLWNRMFARVFEEHGVTMADIFIATEVVARRLVPLPAEDAPANFRELALRCVRYEPADRPKLSEVLRMISEQSM